MTMRLVTFIAGELLIAGILIAILDLSLAWTIAAGAVAVAGSAITWRQRRRRLLSGRESSRFTTSA